MVNRMIQEEGCHVRQHPLWRTCCDSTPFVKVGKIYGLDYPRTFIPYDIKTASKSPLVVNCLENLTVRPKLPCPLAIWMVSTITVSFTNNNVKLAPLKLSPRWQSHNTLHYLPHNICFLHLIFRYYMLFQNSRRRLHMCLGMI